jgi:hypothetical protein
MEPPTLDFSMMIVGTDGRGRLDPVVPKKGPASAPLRPDGR